SPPLPDADALAQRIALLERRAAVAEQGRSTALEPVLAEMRGAGTLLRQMADALATLEERVDGLEAERRRPIAAAPAANAAPTVVRPPAAPPARPPLRTPAADAIAAAISGGQVDLHLQPI